MKDFKNIVIDTLEQKLEDYEGNMCVYGADLSYTLLESYNIDGTYTYNTYKSKQMIKTYFDELGEIYNNYILNFGKENALDPFNNAEEFIVIMLLEKASELLYDCQFISDNWNNEFDITKENIDIIKGQLENLR